MKALGTVAVHPAAAIFPMLSPDELRDLADDIKERGLIHPIELLDGAILDGRNRWAACELAGVEPTTVNVQTDDPIRYVVSGNVKRRNLSRDQLAIAAAEAWEQYEVGAGRPAGNSGRTAPNSEDRTRKRLAQIFGVGEKAIQQAHKLVGDPSENAALAVGLVKAGEAQLTAAYQALARHEQNIELAIQRYQELQQAATEARKRMAAYQRAQADVEHLPRPKRQPGLNVAEVAERFIDALGPEDDARAAESVVAWSRAMTGLREALAAVKALEFPWRSRDGKLLALQAEMFIDELHEVEATLAAKLSEQTLTRVK